MLLAYLDGELPPARKFDVDGHLGTCPACAKLFAASIDEAFAAPLAPDQEIPDQTQLRWRAGGKVGRYVVLAPIGAGGMGVVYSAYDPELGRQMALKLLRPEKDERGEARARLLREAQAMARLSHPNVVTVYDVGTFGSQVFIAMEFVEGGTLAQWRSVKRRSWREIVNVFLRAGQGLAAAHAAGLVHRDFKPDNVLMGEDGRVRVTDFGLARIAEGEDADFRLPTPLYTRKLTVPALHSSLTQTGMLVGSPAYMAPEQMQGNSADVRSDVFSFCIALYESLCGERPFAGSTFAELRDEVAAGKMRELPQGVQLPAFLHRLLARGLQALPDDRYQTMEALLADLERGPIQRMRRKWMAAGVLVLLASGAAFTLEARRRDPARLCPGGEHLISRIWNEQHKKTIETVFKGASIPYPLEQARTAARGLDAYGAAWASMFSDACLATRVRHEQTADVLGLRQKCLGQRLQEMAALISLLETADARVAQRAQPAVASLTPLSRCASEQLLLGASEKLPSGPQTEQRMAAASEALAEARARYNLGAYQTSFDQLVPVVAAARELRYTALEAEALLLQGQDEDYLGHYENAERLLREAGILAELARRDDLAAKAFTQLIYVTGNDLDRVQDALRWAELAQVAIDHAGGGSDLERMREKLLGGVLAQHGRAPEALPHLERALQLAEKDFGPDAPQIATAVEAVAVGLFFARRHEEALPLFRRSLALAEKLYHSEHPQLGEILDSIGETLLNLGRPAEAEAPLWRSLAIYEVAFGPDHVLTASTRSSLSRALREKGSATVALPLAQAAADFCKQPGRCELQIIGHTNHELGATLLALGRRAEALGPITRALDAREKAGHIDLPDSQFALAQALWAQPAQRKRALDLAGKARRSYAGNEPRLLAEVDAWLARRR